MAKKPNKNNGNGQYYISNNTGVSTGNGSSNSTAAQIATPTQLTVDYNNLPNNNTNNHNVGNDWTSGQINPNTGTNGGGTLPNQNGGTISAQPASPGGGGTGNGGGSGSNSAQPASPYGGVQGISGQVGQQIGNMIGGYQPSQNVLNAQNILNNWQQQQPGSYESQYGDMMNQLLQQIMNPEEFNYEFNTDNLFQSFADMYQQNAQQAAANAMGNAAGLTGGYGNSYASTVGNQQYQQTMNDLYDKGMNFYTAAWNEYLNEQQNPYNQLAAVLGQDQNAYNQHQGNYNNWLNTLGQYANNYFNMNSQEQQQFQNQFGNMLSLLGMENTDYWNGQNMEQNQQQNQQQLAMQLVPYYVQSGQKPPKWLLEALGMTASQFANMYQQSGGSGGSGGKPSKTGQDQQGANPFQQAYNYMNGYANGQASAAANPTAQAIQQLLQLLNQQQNGNGLHNSTGDAQHG